MTTKEQTPSQRIAQEVFDAWTVNLFNYPITHRLAKQPWRDEPVALFDIEADSIDPNDPDINLLQLSCKVVRDPELQEGSNVIETFSQFVNPKQAVAPGSMEVHGLYHKEHNSRQVIQEHGEKDLSTYPPIEDVIDDIRDYMRQWELWGAFNHEYDCNVLNNALKQTGRDTLLRPTLDPMIFEWYRTHRLSGTLWGVAKRFGATQSANPANLHDADVDVDVLNDLLWEMADRHFPFNVRQTLTYQTELFIERRNHAYEKHGD